MGLMDKFKNLFTDEEVIEEESEPIEIKEIKKEEEVHQLPTFMREKIRKENEQQEKVVSFTKDLKETEEFGVRELKLDTKLDISLNDELPSVKKVDEKKNFKFPMELSDNDFVETRSRQSIRAMREKVEPQVKPVEPIKKIESNKNLSKKESPIKKETTKVSELYKDKKNDVVSEKKFRATPIISPIYGVLDKNYSSNDVECSKGENLEYHRHSKNVDFDSVRKKAYGSIADEIKENLMCENCEYLKEAKECKKKEQQIVLKEEPLVYDVLEEPMVLRRDITLDEATENYYDYGVEYEKFQDPDEIKILNHEVEVDDELRLPKKEIPPVKSSINLLSTLKKSMGDNVEAVSSSKTEKNLELTDDLFNLIDSMYDERNDS